ncbi:hypothetical protein WJX82_008910 [Trebouxia sp. C0006]
MSAANVVCQSLVAKRTCKTNHAIQRRHVSPVLGIECAVQSCAFPPSAAFRNGRRTQEVPKEVAAIFQKLQNGSDIRGIAIAGVEGEEQNITPTVAFFIGVGFASWLSETLKMPANSLHISIGRDSRLSGPLLLASMVAGLASQGVSVAQFGLATTPAMFMSCIIPGYEYDGGIIITASHLPFNRNGFKFFTKEGGLEKGDIKIILQRAATAAHAAGTTPHARHSDDALVLDAALNTDPSSAQHVDFMPVYAEHLQNIIKQGVDRKDNFEKPLEGFKVAVDPGNGAGGYFATDVLQPLGCDISGSQFLEPDGWFPNHVPNPEDKTAMAAGVQAVQQSNSDLGVVLDTDVDRSAVVARDGQPINSNRYIALMSLITLRKYPGTTIVTDSVTSNGLSDFIKARGGHHYRWKRGYKNVIGKGIELNKAGTDTPLMMETSGHGAMKENHFLDDGAYSAVQIIIETVRRRLAGEGDIAVELLKDLKEPKDASEFRMKITAQDFKPVGEKVLAAFHDWLESGAGGAFNWSLAEVNHEGWRVTVDEGEGRMGWLLLRASLHDPLLVLNVESELEGGVEGTVSHLKKFFAEHKEFELDTSKL